MKKKSTKTSWEYSCYREEPIPVESLYVVRLLFGDHASPSTNGYDGEGKFKRSKHVFN